MSNVIFATKTADAKKPLIWVKQQEKPNQINDVLGTQPQNAYFTPLPNYFPVNQILSIRYTELNFFSITRHFSGQNT